MTTRKRPEELRSHRWLGRERSAFVRPPLAAAPGRLRHRRLGRPAGDRHHQHLERHQSVPHASAPARGGSEARRAAGRRISDRAARDVARRSDGEADHHALSQLPRDGDRGAAALAPDRRRGAARRLRQDHARPRDGRDQHGASVDLCTGRPDAARQLARASSSAPVRTSGNTGTRSAPATSPKPSGTRSRTASRARSAPA